MKSKNVRIPKQLVENEDFYLENGLFVLTEKFLRARGHCCTQGCRHCPYKGDDSLSVKTVLKQLLFLGLLSSFCWSCGERSCKFGKPIAIFPKGVELVQEQSFETKEQNAFETVIFKSGIKLQITQTGCNDLKQLFEFSQKGNFTQKDDAFWKQATVKQLQAMAKMHPQLKQFEAWAEAINAILPNLKLGEVVALQSNIFVKIDKITNGQEATLLLELAQKR